MIPVVPPPELLDTDGGVVIKIVPHVNRGGQHMLVSSVRPGFYGMVVEIEDGSTRTWYPVPYQVVEAMTDSGVMPGDKFIVSENKLASPAKRWRVKKLS